MKTARGLPAANQTLGKGAAGVFVCQSSSASLTLLCAFLRRFCPLAYSCRRVAARAARLSIKRSLGELFANDSDEKRVSRGTWRRDREEGQTGGTGR